MAEVVHREARVPKLVLWEVHGGADNQLNGEQNGQTGAVKNVGWFRSRVNLIFHYSQLEVDSAVNREPVQSFKQNVHLECGHRIE